MRVLVTGGSGFIGSRVVRALIEGGHAVRCLVRKTSKTERIDGLPWERCEGDVRDRASLGAALAGCDAIVHLASPSSWSEINSPLLEEVVVEGTRNVLAAAQAAGGRRVVFCSSVTALGGTPRPEVMDEHTDAVPDPRLRYAHCKRRAEELCTQAVRTGLPVVIVNPAEVYGPEDTAFITAGNLVDFAKSSPVLICHGGTAVVHVDDVAQGIVRALERGRPGERYILGGENLTIRELAALTLELLAQKKRIVALPTPVIRGVSRAAQALHIPLPFNPLVIPYATRYWFVDSSKARSELGVSFRSARETLEPTIRWLREAGHIGRA
jgi:dihydroflavonol-4-reductase